MGKIIDNIIAEMHRYGRSQEWYRGALAGELSRLEDRFTAAQAEIERLTAPVGKFEEGEFTSCADVLDDWFNACNVQGTAEMETVEVEELLEEMKRIEAIRNAPVDGEAGELVELRTLISKTIAAQAENAELREALKTAKCDELRFHLASIPESEESSHD